MFSVFDLWLYFVLKMTGMYAAIPFVTLKDDQYVVNEECISFLNALKGDIGIVTIAGKYRTGKSFFLNRCVLDEPFEGGFNIGSTIQACTKGIWLYTKPIECTDAEGNKFSAIVMDTEGIGALDADSTHDSRIFALALLLSSLFIYNSVGSIDEGAVNTLSLVSNISQHIRIKSKEEPSQEELGRLFPSFLWVVRDFSLRLVNASGEEIGAQDYLEDALKGDETVRRALRDCFPVRQCLTLVRPCVDEDDLQLMGHQPVQLRPAFVQQLDSVRQEIYRSVPRKTVMGKTICGSMLGMLAKSYTASINSGAAPVIKDSWELLSEVQCRHSLDESVSKFEDEVGRCFSGVMHSDALEIYLDNCIQDAMSSFLKGATESHRVEYQSKLSKILSARKVSIQKTNKAEADKRMYLALTRMNDCVHTLGSVEELQIVYNQTKEMVVSEVGAACEPRWDALISEHIWGWVKSLVYRLGDVNKQTASRLEHSEEKIRGLVVDFEAYRTQSTLYKTNSVEAMAEYKMSMQQMEEKRNDGLQQITILQATVQRLQSSNEVDRNQQGLQDKKTIEDLHTKLVLTTDECALKVGDSDTRLRVVSDQLEDLQKQLEQRQEELDGKNLYTDGLLHKLQAYEKECAEVENREVLIAELRSRLQHIEHDREVQDTDFTGQLADLSSTTEEIISQLRKSAYQDRVQSSSEIQDLRSKVTSLTEEHSRVLETTTQHLHSARNQVEGLQTSQQEMSSRYQADIDSSRQELTRVSAQWENHHDARAEMVKMIESHWQQDVLNKTTELEELKTLRQNEQLDMSKKLREAESQLSCSNTLLKENKRRLYDAEERASNKKLKIEHEDVKSRHLKASVQLDCLKETARDTQQRVKELHITNIKLERKCKDLERQREVDVLKMRLSYEKQLAAL